MKTILFLLAFFPWITDLYAQAVSHHYVAVVFQNNNPTTVVEGDLDTATYKEWFASGWSIAGTRNEIPVGSVPIGALFIYSKAGTLTLPFYQMLGGGYLCQSHRITEPPMFSAYGNTEAEFIADLKRRLANLR